MTAKKERYRNLTFASVTEIGADHKLHRMANQDAVGFSFVGEDFVLAVSDGVGSCEKAESGSSYAVQTCLDLFDRIRRRSLPFDSGAIAKALIAEWRSRISDGKYDDYCATVNAAVKIGSTLKLISLGDGMIGVTSDGIRFLSPEEKASFANVTNCLSGQVLPSDIGVFDFPLDLHIPYAVFCCTDGVSGGIMPGRELELVEEIERHIGADDLEKELIGLLEEISAYSFDDMTVGVVKYEGQH